MLISDYVAGALRTAKTMPDRAAELEHASLGLITELGELATEVKRQRIYIKPVDRAHVAEEVGDLLWYCAVACPHLLDLKHSAFPVVQAGTKLTPGHTPDQHLSLLMRRLAANVGEFAALTHAGELADAAERLLDIITCLAGVCIALDLSLDECAQQNLDKLRLRFPDKFTEAAAEARADKGGLDARVS